jgi:CRISPR-associated protein Cas5h
MEIIQFDIEGKFAHFRKYYANNTAMSFSIPPRTTLMGILAGILGLPKDSYYEALASENIRIGVAVKSPIKKTFHRLNLLSIKSKGDVKKSFDSDFRGSNGRIQTPFEIISGQNIQQDMIIYRIFVGYFDSGKPMFEDLKNNLLNHQTHFQTTLGIAQFLASIKNCQLIQHSDMQKSENEWISFNSAVISESVSELNFKDTSLQYFLEEELLPADFKANYDRELSKMNRILFTSNNIPLKVRFNGTYYRIETEGEIQNIQFLE